MSTTYTLSHNDNPTAMPNGTGVILEGGRDDVVEYLESVTRRSDLTDGSWVALVAIDQDGHRYPVNVTTHLDADEWMTDAEAYTPEDAA